MKPKWFFILIFLILIINTHQINSQEDLIQIIPYNSEISPGEVYQAEIIITDPVTQLKKQNIKVYSLNNITQPISPFLNELETNHYFLYFEVPTIIEDGEYILMVEDQSFLINNILTILEEERQFTVLHSQPSVSITPAYFKISSKQVGQITINAIAKDITTQIEFSVPSYISHSYVTDQYLNPNSLRKFIFNYDTENATFSEIIFSYGSKTFTVPIFIENQEETPEETIEDSEDKTTNPITFFVDNNILDKKLKNTESLEGNLNMKNNLETSLSNLNIELTGNLNEVMSISSNTINSVSSLSNFSTFLKINPDKTAEEGVYDGNLILSNDAYISSLYIKIEIYKEITEEQKEIEIIDTNLETDDEKLSGREQVVNNIIPWNLSDGYEDEVKSTASPFMFIIILFLGIGIIIFLLSGKKKTQKKSFQQLMKENKR